MLDLRTLRQQRDMTLAEVAAELGIKHRAQVHDWESGRRKPGRKYLTALADLYKVSVADLLK